MHETVCSWRRITAAPGSGAERRASAFPWKLPPAAWVAATMTVRRMAPSIRPVSVIRRGRGGGATPHSTPFWMNHGALRGGATRGRSETRLPASCLGRLPAGGSPRISLMLTRGAPAILRAILDPGSQVAAVSVWRMHRSAAGAGKAAVSNCQPGGVRGDDDTFSARPPGPWRPCP